MSNELLMILISSGLTGIVSTVGTVKALSVHINYLKKSVDDNCKAIERAHQRIDEIKSH